ncbi:MAG: sulfatase [Gammaproteobacteria bacterium]|nr:sulfatase [Gammaproteobacteria bacterium]RPG23314.1 MAG: sulfatase [Gammaproteobacteria bacterium TMED50]
MTQQANIVIIMTDQQRADVSSREGFPLDTTPFLDALAKKGTWFDRAYTTMPVCLPARVSLLTGRYPSATRARTNHNGEDAYYETDLFDLMRAQGYRLALCGKNHSHVKADRMDHMFNLGHHGGGGDQRTEDEIAFDAYLASLRMSAGATPAPFGVEVQCPYRAVTDATRWIDEDQGEQPFFLWLSFPEPHNPYQAPEPYFSMFPPETLPLTQSDASSLAAKGYKYQFLRELGETAFPDYDEQLVRARSNYLGMLRLIDDQVSRFFDYLDANNLRDKTIVFFLSDHGDYVGEYGLVRKGAELPEVIARIPFQVVGPGVVASDSPHAAHVSTADVMPTICEAMGVDVPRGVQGRSLWSMLTGQDYPEDEFDSVYMEHGFGGLHYTAEDNYDRNADGLSEYIGFDELNGVSQSGTMRALRCGDWKLIYDMQERGQLYNLPDDPVELNNLFDHPEHAEVQSMMLGKLLGWTLRVQDPLPHPRRRYQFKSDKQNYWSPHANKTK